MKLKPVSLPIHLSVIFAALAFFSAPAFAGCHLVFQGIASHLECDPDPCGGTGCTVIDDPVTSLHAVSLAWNSQGAWALYEGSSSAEAQNNARIHCANCSIADTVGPESFGCIAVAQKGTTFELWQSRQNSYQGARNLALSECNQHYHGGCELKYALCNNS